MTEKDIIICGHGSGRPSTKNMYAYLESRHNSFATNGKRKELIAVRRYKNLNENDRMKFQDTYDIILGRNYYSQALRQYVFQRYNDGNYYSDCSSSGCATLNACGKTCELLNTAGIYSSSRFENVPVTIVDGHITNPELLEVGDALLFIGNDPSRPKQIGHVEWVYEIPMTYPVTIVSGTQTIVAESLNIRREPVVAESNLVGTYSKGTKVDILAKSGTWFKTKVGWISRNHTVGWVNENDSWWYNESGTYPINEIKTIDGEDYIFDREGWCITKDRISDSCAIIY